MTNLCRQGPYSYIRDLFCGLFLKGMGPYGPSHIKHR
jgi:hypothetical protein